MSHLINFSRTLRSLSAPLIMGILNVTDDSFYDGGRYRSEAAMIERAGEMLRDGADIIDIGAMSTRPGAQELPAGEEENRIRQAVATVKASFPEAVVSIDTWRASVARAAVREGAGMINDISGGTFDPDMIPAIGEMQVPYVLMHTPAKPDKMQQCTQYDDILADMLRFFGEQIAKLHAAHVHDIVIDPGFGFGKTLEQNYFLMRNLEAFKVFDLPILVGISRKSMIYKFLNTTPEHALNGTTVLNTLALEHGASVLRVHDVKEAVEVRKLVVGGWQLDKDI
ncbi:MAG: dihydropteroate synthase [Bacteroidales bacterium]|nr:dihydropteroate synthase [Bacteroidales bacterium]